MPKPRCKSSVPLLQNSHNEFISKDDADETDYVEMPQESD